mmetsp:Transcript_68010/g.134817  ORF Transcript_68010/g.134817 Transcript_68010/m.134817 type:complete len:229 (-) Transcript_68010:296-982(-)
MEALACALQRVQRGVLGGRWRSARGRRHVRPCRHVREPTRRRRTSPAFRRGAHAHLPSRVPPRVWLGRGRRMARARSRRARSRAKAPAAIDAPAVPIALRWLGAQVVGPRGAVPTAGRVRGRHVSPSGAAVATCRITRPTPCGAGSRSSGGVRRSGAAAQALVASSKGGGAACGPSSEVRAAAGEGAHRAVGAPSARWRKLRRLRTELCTELCAERALRVEPCRRRDS